MVLGNVLISFLHMLLYCAVVVFVAVLIWWAWNRFFEPMDERVFYWGRVVVMLICAIAFIGWALSLLGIVAPGTGYYDYGAPPAAYNNYHSPLLR